MHEPPSINAADVIVYGIYVAIHRWGRSIKRAYSLLSGVVSTVWTYVRSAVTWLRRTDPQRSVNYCGVRKWIFRDTCLRDGYKLMSSRTRTCGGTRTASPRSRPDRRCPGIIVVDNVQFQYSSPDRSVVEPPLHGVFIALHTTLSFRVFILAITTATCWTDVRTAWSKSGPTWLA